MKEKSGLNLWRLGVAMLLILNAEIGNSAVRLVEIPNEGIQPQAVMDSEGILHLLYFKGKPSGGDAFYVRSANEGRTFSEPLRVNQRAGCVMAIGTIRGAQLAIGRGGRPHVAWMGTVDPSDDDQDEPHRRHPMLYTRLNGSGTAFEAERNLVTWAGGLDGGGSLAADSDGNVYVAWHGSAPDNTEKEFGRAVYVARSADDGATFQREKRALKHQTGACGCCGMKMFTDSRSDLYVLYRSATPNGRDMELLVSHDEGETFSLSKVNQWAIESCPMSSASFAEDGDGILLGTERKGRVEFRRWSSGSFRDLESANTSEMARGGKYPSVARDTQGRTLQVWVQGGGWNKGGILRWIARTASGDLEAVSETEVSIPAWSYASGVALRGGGFLIVH